MSIVPPSKGLETFGNIVQYGVDSNDQCYSYSVDESELTDVENSYITIGADGSIRIHSDK